MPEITTPGPVPLQIPSGKLNPAAVGWSRKPIHDCALHGAPLRKKRWNYWAFTTERYLFSATVSDIDYAAVAFVYVADLESGEFLEDTVITPFGRGCQLGDTVGDDARFSGGGLIIELLQDTRENVPVVTVTADMPGFAGRGLRAAMTASYPAGHETLNVVVPWSERRFQFTAKHNTLPATGNVQVGSHNFEFAGEQSFACLDFGRGIWPYRCAWNWGAASGHQGGHVYGLNLGGQWTDGTGATENALCIDGILSKIEQDLTWEYDRGDWLRPWRIFTPGADTVDLHFTPRLERVAASNALLVRSEVHQMLGHYSGTVIDTDGACHHIEDLPGWAEDHRAAW